MNGKRKNTDIDIVFLGHVDSGKSEVFALLTGEHPDLLEEEKMSFLRD